MIFYWVNGHFPVIFLQFDETLRKTYNILKVYIDVQHAMCNQEVAFQALSKIDGRGA
jgi:hypothetical protein